MGVRETFSVETAGTGDFTTVVVTGALSDDSTAEVRRAIEQAIDAGARAIALDMAQVNYISSSGIGMLVSVRKRSSRESFSLALCGLSRDLLELFALTRLDQVFTLARSVEHWRTALGGEAS